jgi:hypothetical protein
MLETNFVFPFLPFSHPITSPPHHNVKIHAIYTNGWIVLNPQINVFLYTEPKVPGIREVLLVKLIFLDS